MKIVIAGSSGLIGGALARRLRDEGNDVTRLVRRAPASGDEARWDPDNGELDGGIFADADAVVHLGGVSIAGKRWNAARKAAIRDSRVNSARLLSETLAGLDAPPATFVCASALGYYGSRADEILTEDSAQGDDFLARTTAEWEAATGAATDAGVRVVNPRIGVVLSAEGDMPKRMLPPFKLGLGGKLGGGRQYMSWVHIGDVVGGFIHAIQTPELRGPRELIRAKPGNQRGVHAGAGAHSWQARRIRRSRIRAAYRAWRNGGLYARLGAPAAQTPDRKRFRVSLGIGRGCAAGCAGQIAGAIVWRISGFGGYRGYPLSPCAGNSRRWIAWALASANARVSCRVCSGMGKA